MSVANLIRGYRAASAPERAAFNMLSAGATTIVVARAAVWLSPDESRVAVAKRKLGRERHVHHYVPGIVLAFSSAVGRFLTTSPRGESLLALPFGTGVGLTLDEAATLFDFQDRYWNAEQIPLVQASIAFALTLALGVRFMRLGNPSQAPHD